MRSIWGCEHVDEIKRKPNGAGNWLYWPEGCSDAEKSGDKNSDTGKENGRLNSAYIWGLYSRKDDNNSGVYYMVDGAGKRDWRHFLKFEVDNEVPELRDDTDGDDYGDGGTHKFHGMAWSCLTRNRDNNGNHKIDPEEVRWYLASSQQLAGIWVGNESLSTSARLYQPAEGQWRAHVVSSTAKLVSWAEEGGGATDIANDWAGGNYHTWGSAVLASAGESVRCVRNIGTYDEGSVVTDISYAPVTLVPDKYFTLKLSDGNTESDNLTYDDANKYYVFHFDRLNTKSIREYSPGELPYHDQNSLNNRVYVKMITQPLSLDVDFSGFDVVWGDINNLVTKAGHNDYCPEGYRFPNHTEWLLMSLYLPRTYLNYDKDLQEYSPNSPFQPSRTYYDRGYYGSKRDAAWESEYGKVGWTYSDKLHCKEYNAPITHSRCVKDEDQTGVISGRIAIEGNVIYPGDEIPIDFKFSSTASTFTNATLTLWYNKNGFLTSYDLTPQMRTPTGLQYKGTQYITMPSLSDLGLTANDLPFNDDLSIEVVFTNRNNMTGRHSLPLTLQNPFSGSTLTPAELFYPADNSGGNISFNLTSSGRTIELNSVKFWITDPNDANRSVQIQGVGGEGLSGRTYSGTSTIPVPSLNDLGLAEHGFNLNWPLTIRADITASDNYTYSVTSAPFHLVSHLAGSSVEFPTAYDETNGIPLNIVAESINNNATINSATLYWKKTGDSSYSSTSLSTGSPSSNLSASTYVNDIIGEAVSAGNKYYFYLMAGCSDGTSIRSDVWSMDILYYGKCWNPGPWTSSNNVGQINVPWPITTISGLHFDEGDFIDTCIDVSNCVYIRKDGTSNNDIGMDNLISIGNSSSDLSWKSGNILFYYPAPNPPEAADQDLLQIGILHYGKSTIARLRPYPLPGGSLTVRLQKDRLLVNGDEPSWSVDYTPTDKPNDTYQHAGAYTEERSRATVSHITDDNTVKIGSVEGRHRSRATYKYVRAVRKETFEP